MCVIPTTIAILLVGNPAPPLPPSDFIFVPDTDRRVSILELRNLRNRIGTLNANGAFHESEYDDLGRPGSFTLKRADGWYPLGYAEPYERINRPGPRYEYRSGRLVLGKINSDGVFVPTPQASAIRFEDYRYSPDATPIWNLPGYFMRRDKLEERRKWLADHLAENPDYAKEKAKLDAAVSDKK